MMSTRLFQFPLLGVFLCVPLCLAGEGLLLNEFMAWNNKTFADSQGDYDDWIEIVNDSNEAVDVAGLYLTDDFNDPTKWQFPIDDPNLTTIAAQGFLLIWADGDLDQEGLHTSFKLSADGEELALVGADGIQVLDSVSFDEQYADMAYGRDPLASGNWRFLAWATPGVKNIPGYLGTVANPVFSHSRGFYDDSFELTLTCDTPDAAIRYTVDGGSPLDGGSTVYTGPITINKTLSVRAYATQPGYVPSQVISHTYMVRVSEGIKSLPVISLTGTAGKTFYEPDGIMAIVGGTYNGGVWQASGDDSYNNVIVHGIERPCSFEYLHANDGNDFQVDCGIRVHGSDWMRPRYTRNSKFSFRLYFRGQYGQSWLDYPLFPFEVDQFKSIVLRGGHNDRTNPFIKDELTRRLLKDMGHVSSGGTFANVFINGEYQGYFNPCEHITESFCRAWFDSELDWDIITHSRDAREGDRIRIEALKQYALTHDLTVPEYYDEVARQIDIEEYVDYLLLRLWAGDWDWPHNNWSAASERSDEGKWRFFVWDAEGGMFNNRLNQVFFDRLHNNNHENSIFYNNLYPNPQFRLFVGDRIQKHFFNGGALTEDHITDRFVEMQEQMRGVLPNMNTYVIDTWTPQRRDIFLNACRQEGVYTFGGPELYLNFAVQHGGYFEPGDQLHMVSPYNGGVIYYTTDGSDPSEHGTVSKWEWTTLVPRSAEKSVLVPTRDIGQGWTVGSFFDDSDWQALSGSPGGVGYERGSGYQPHIGLNVDAAMASQTSCYLRIPFTLSQRMDDVEALSLRIQYDDGFIAYLNGTEVARRNFVGSPSWNSVASDNHDDGAAVAFEPVDITDALPRLKNGENILAIHGLNRSTGSSDFLINAELVMGTSEPVEIGGDVNTFDDPISLTESTHVKARVLVQNSWSTLAEGTFALKTVIENLRITEMMYHPADSGDPNDPNAEFIELQNTGEQTINLAMVRFTDGIGFEFPRVDVNAGDRLLVVKDRSAFEAKYGPGLPIAGEYTGSLNNGGEWVELVDAVGEIIHRFRYRDDWYDETDGDGYSLVVRDPIQASGERLSDKDIWQLSTTVGGTPGL